MTKKHFIMIADALRTVMKKPQCTPMLVLLALCEVFKEINPRFDKTRWIGYILGTNGPSGGKR